MLLSLLDVDVDKYCDQLGVKTFISLMTYNFPNGILSYLRLLLQQEVGTFFSYFSIKTSVFTEQNWEDKDFQWADHDSKWSQKTTKSQQKHLTEGIL